MNILLTSVGRRAYLVKYFKEVVGEEGKVHVSNSDNMTVAFQYADEAVVTPLIYDDNYIPFLLEYCKKNEIDILLSLFDIDLPVLAKNKEAFRKIGTTVVVSEAKFVEICNDKWKTYCFLKENGFSVPKTYLSLNSVQDALKKGEVCYPIIIKPRFGCGSISVLIAEDEIELAYLYKKAIKAVGESYLRFESEMEENKVVFQEMLAGQEYGIDIINDLKGEFKNAIIKKKIAMRAGETDIAETVECEKIYDIVSKLGKITGHIANLDCDVFLIDGEPYILEMNARFGGGYPFSHVAGCDLPMAIVKWVNEEDVDPSLLQAEIGMRSFKELVMTKG